VRVLYIVTAFPRDADDVITPWLVETVARLRARLIEVEVLAPSYRGLGDQVQRGVRVHRFRYAPAGLERLTHDQPAPDRLRERPYYAALLPGYLAAGTAAAVRLARSGRFDVVHAFWPLPHGVFGVAARRLAGVPLVSTFFGVELRWLRRELPFLAPVVRAIVRRSDAVTVISSHTRAELLRLVPGAAVRTIPFGAAVAAPAAGGRRPGQRGAGGGFELLFVGRLVERKGVEVLLRALARLSSGAPVRLTVVGGGPLRRELEVRAEALGVAGSVHFTGFVPAEEMADHFGAADALVLPAVEDAKGDVEGLGVVLVEALTHGLPVIASASGGIPDIVRDGVTGLLVPPGDEVALAAAITRLRDDAALGARLAAAGREHVARHFSWQRIVDGLIEVYAEVVGSHARVADVARVAD
jgi:glycosyltransferase involved in cell wall biosynthesis